METLHIRLDARISSGEFWDILFFDTETEADWKALTPPLESRLVVTVTLTATDPEGLSASVSGDFLVTWESSPEVESAVGRERAIELTFDWAVEDTPAPTPEQFTVKVENADGSTGTIAVESVSVSGKVVTLGLASALAEGQTVTLDYAYNYSDDVPLQRAGGGDPAPGFSGLAVELSLVEPPGAPENFSVSAEPGELSLWATWDAVEGATSYQLRWRQADGEFEADNATMVTDTGANITVSGYGRWEVRLQACNDGSCGLEVSQTVDTVVPAIWLKLAPAKDAQGEVRPRTFTATWESVEGAASYTLRWRRVEADSPVQESLDPTPRQNHVAGGDGGQRAHAQGENQLDLPGDRTTADFTVSDDGEYEAELEAKDEGDAVIARGENVNRASDTADTTPPWLVSGEIDGDRMTLYFSEPLDEDAVGLRLHVTLHFPTPGYGGWAYLHPRHREVKISGNKVEAVGLLGAGCPCRAYVGYPVEVYYYIDDRNVPVGDQLRDLAGNGVWTPYQTPSGLPRTRTINLVNRSEPPLLERATAHPHWLTLTFDDTMDGNWVPGADAFTVQVNGSPVSLANMEPVIVAGDTVTLVLSSAVSSTDVVTVSYAKPSASPLRGVDGAARSFSGRSVTNLVGVEPSVSQVAITSTPAADNIYAPGETIQVTVTFTEAVAVTGTPRLKIKMDPDYREKWANYAPGSGVGTTTLAFAYTVVEPNHSGRGVAVLAHTLELNGGSIRSVATSADANLRHARLGHDPDHKVDWRRSAPGVPWVTGVAISSDPGDDDTYVLGETIHMAVTFSEVVNVDTTFGSPRLKIKMDPDYGENWANYASGDGTAELTFAYTVVEPNHSGRGVAVLSNTLELNGGTIRSVGTPQTGAHLRHEGLSHDPNHRVDIVKPSLQDAAVNRATVVLTFNEPLDADAAPPASAFTVKKTPQGRDEETVSLSGLPEIAGSAVILTLLDPVLDSDADVKVSYSKPPWPPTRSCGQSRQRGRELHRPGRRPDRHQSSDAGPSDEPVDQRSA